ncbi:MAG: ADP-ribosylglycohydrolase family protein [Methanomicrobiales archaeon]|nr:ADP-ribosylglycohydrolase family protein [Methanomicrobiales archaeon]
MTEPRTLGGILGFAIGDALGAPVEGLPPPPVPVRDMTGGGPCNRKAGCVTDDTCQALAVARSLIGRGGFDPEDILHGLLEMYRRDPGFYGPTSTAVFEQILRGVPGDQAARRVHEARGSRSNGSVMRGPPLGLYFRDPEYVREVSLACSRLTHLDPVTGECSAIVNVMVSRLARGSLPEHALRDALLICGSDEVVGMLSRYWRYPIKPSLDALLTTHAAISVFLSSHSLEEALIGAVNRGGDTDTVGALTGVLSGAHWGYAAIPVRWIEGLQDAAEIRQVAHRLWMTAEQ